MLVLTLYKGKGRLSFLPFMGR